MVELRPHQKKAVRELDNGKILWGDVGTGKSITALAYYVERESPRDIYVITTAMKRDTLDWNREGVHFAIGTVRPPLMHGAMTVDSWNNIGKYENVTDAFFIFDEQRLVGSGAWTRAFLRIAKRNRWILLTATPGDTWLDYIPVFVANGFYKNRTQFKLEHVIYRPYVNFPQVDRYVNQGKLLKHRNELLVHMPYTRQTIRLNHEWISAFPLGQMNDVTLKRWNPYTSEPIRDAAEFYRTQRRIVNSSVDRLADCIRIVGTKPKVIIFYNFDYELLLLREGLKGLKPEIREWNGHQHDPVPGGKEWVYLVQYTAGAEGWNCTTCDTMVFWSLPYSYKAWHQAHGRIDRMNTPFKELHYYTLRSDAKIDQLVLKSLKAKRDFQEPVWDTFD